METGKFLSGAVRRMAPEVLAIFRRELNAYPPEARANMPNLVVVYPVEAYACYLDYQQLQGVELPIVYKDRCPWRHEAAREFWLRRCRLPEGAYSVVDPPREARFRDYWIGKGAVE